MVCREREVAMMNGNSFEEMPMDAMSGTRETQADARSGVREVPAADAVAMHRSGDDVVYLDVRESNEWNLFRIPGAVHLPLARVQEGVNEVIPLDRRVVVYCARGMRAAQAADAMRTLGYGRVTSITGGLMAWVEAGGELEE